MARNRYNPEYYHNKSLELRDTVSKEDALAWYNHPCTQSLRNALEGDLSGIVLTWIGGAYFDEESSSGTAQKHSKALGMIQAVSGFLDTLDEIRDNRSEGEEYDNGTP